MPRKTFVNWLRQQRGRDDAVGDLARDALADSALRGKRFSVEDLRQRLIQLNACEGARIALHDARREYRTWAC
jgi:hypothetical protein